jgi:hypothetical protein
MSREVEVIHWKGADTSIWMPYAPAIKVKRGHLVFIAGCTAAPMYHHHPHRPEEFDKIPPRLGDQTRLEGMQRSLQAAGRRRAARSGRPGAAPPGGRAAAEGGLGPRTPRPPQGAKADFRWQF